ncbi:MAG: nucleotidyl transferase AbiEii/AbiGii toxin family protein [Candidatus Shapirobacteria bacterium]|jgi:hypothetical protein
MFWNILDQNRLNILPKLTDLSKDFYLAGGTGLALQLGHRDSIDFDFFTKTAFSNMEIFNKIKRVFIGHIIVKNQDEKDTLTVFIDENIKLSFFRYKYDLIKPLVSTEFFKLASIEDIGCMKLSAIVSRYLLKDYVDLYWILHQISLSDLISLDQKKHWELDTNLVLKSLVYFDDVELEPIVFKNKMEVSFDEVKKFLRKTVKKFLD